MSEIKGCNILTIKRSVKPAGLLFAARTYRIVLNELGLYIIYIGRAMGNKVMPESSFEKIITDTMVIKIENKMMSQLKELGVLHYHSELTHELNSKKSRYFKSPSEVKLSFHSLTNNQGKLRVKGKGLDLKLVISPDDCKTVVSILNEFNEVFQKT